MATVESGETSQERAYWAFLSYSHADSACAAWLSRRIEDYRIPRAFIGREGGGGAVPSRLRPVFRDREELEANAHLGDRIRRALQAARNLIVICSPAAAASIWVNREIDYFRSLHGDQRIFCLIVGGEPFAAASGKPAELECIPPALLAPATGAGSPVDDHFIAADLRPGGDGRRLALLKLIAGMMGVGLDDLVHRDARRHVQQLTIAASLSLAGAVVMAAMAALAIAARNEARQQRSEAEGLIEFMLGDVRRTLEPEGKLDALQAIGQRAMKYYGAQPTGSLDASSLGRRSRVLHLMGDVSDQRGDLAAALTFFQQAAGSTGELLKRKPDDPDRIFDHAQSVYYVGYIAYRRGRTAEAERRFEEYRLLAERLIAIDPNSDKYLAEVGYAESNLGTLYLESGRPAEAIAAFSRRLTAHQQLVRHAPDDRDRLGDLGQSYAWLADANLMTGRLQQAFDDRTAERRIYDAILSRTPAEPAALQAMVVNRQGMANVFMEQRRFQDAIRELEQASDEADVLLKSDPGAARYQDIAAPTFITLGDAQLSAGRSDAALISAERAVAMSETLARKDPSVIDWTGRDLGGARMLSIRIRAVRAKDRDTLVRVLEPAEAEGHRLMVLARGRPKDLGLAKAAAEAMLLAGDLASLSGDAGGARTRWSNGADILLSTGALDPGRAGYRTHTIYQRLRGRMAGPSLTFARIRGAPAYVW